MAGLISTKYNPPPAGKATARGIFVQGIRYANAAAKFWPSLLDEVRAEFPGCSVVGLSAPSSCQLCRDHLFPALSLERDMEKLVGTDIGKAMKETMAELEIMGPPTSVRIRLLSEGGEELLSRDLPLDSIDSEIFPYLVVWLFEWAGIPDTLWNSEVLNGKLTGPYQFTGRIVAYGSPAELRASPDEHVQRFIHAGTVEVH